MRCLSFDRYLFPGVAGIALLVIIAVAASRVLPPSVLEPAPFPTPAATRDARWRQDLDYFAAEVTRLHHNAFRSISRREFEAAVAALHHCQWGWCGAARLPLR